jgi:hypothetical protein
MPRLPFSDRAVIDLRKIEDYCLSTTHPRGRHKARVFREALGLRNSDATWLRSRFLEAIDSEEATYLTTDAWGSHWRMDIPIQRHEKRLW